MITRLIARVNATALVPAALTPPVSKSDAQRALVLFDDVTLPPDADLPDDVRILRDGLTAIRNAHGAPVTIDCHDGGAPLRILLGQAAVTPGAHVTFTGSARLGERPHEPLLAALEGALGDSGLVITRGSPWPIVVRAGSAPRAAAFAVDARASSQFATSLLLASARLPTPAPVVVEGEAASSGYLDLTVEWLRRAGFAVHGTSTLRLTREAEAASTPLVPGDWSSLGYLLAIAWRTGGTVRGVDLSVAHPDRAVVRILAEAGIHLERRGDDFAVVGTAVRGLRASGRECPDALPTLAAIACVLPAPSTFTDVSILRVKESDRLAGIVALAQVGAATPHTDGDTVTLVPGTRAQAFSFDSVGDHRLAMAATTLAVLTGAELSLTDPDVVTKSFPGFWRELARAGVRRA